MNVSGTLSALKPYVGGAVIGAIAIMIVAFSAGWVVTAGTVTERVQQTKVTVLAQLCEADALAYWKKQDNAVAALEGWNNEDRQKLAERFTPSVANDTEYYEDVVDQCDDLLRPA